MRKPLRLALVVLGLALAVYGTASLTGGWLGVPSHQPNVVSYGTDSPEVARNRNVPQRSVDQLDWPLLWYERTEERWVDFDAFTTRGPPRATPALYVTTTIGPRPGRAWISGAVIAVGVGLAAWGSVAEVASASGGGLTDLDVKPEKLSPLGYGMAAWLIACCVCSSVVGLLGGAVALDFGARWKGAVMLAVGVGSIVAVVTLVRFVVHSIRLK